MFIMTVLYPRTDDATFDMDYYTSTHMPMVADALGDDCQGWGAVNVADGKHMVMAWASVTSQEAFEAAMAKHGAEIMGDIPNFTNTQPEVLLGTMAGSG